MEAIKVLLVLCVMAAVCYPSILDDVPETDVSAVRFRLEDEKGRRLLLENDIEVLMKKVAKLERMRSKTTESPECHAISPSTNTTVSFHAGYSGPHLKLQSGQVLIFDQIFTNNGDGYSAVTGIFRAPVSGVYSFTVSILAITSSMHGQILKNGNSCAKFYSTQSVSQTAILNLEVDDEVFIRETTGTKGEIHGGLYCWFSGMRL